MVGANILHQGDQKESMQAATVTPFPAPATRMLYDRKEAARQLSVSVRTFDYLIAGGAFETRRIGKKVLIPHGSLVRYAQGNHYESPKGMAEAA
jgi:hypothetical protein